MLTDCGAVPHCQYDDDVLTTYGALDPSAAET